MAEVWEAHDVVLDRPVAVKLLHAHLASDETFLERFRREAVAAAGLAHRNVISTYDNGQLAEVASWVRRLPPRSPPDRYRRRTPFASPPKWPTPLNTRTERAWCTATSSPPTSSCSTTAA
jgi:hypothetical protein